MSVNIGRLELTIHILERSSPGAASRPVTVDPRVVRRMLFAREIEQEHRAVETNLLSVLGSLVWPR